MAYETTRRETPMSAFIRVVGATALALALLLGVRTPASAQTVCGERSQFLHRLSKSHSESPVAMGLVSSGSVLEVLASENGSWTIIVTMPTGNSCVVAAGEAWENLPVPVRGRPAAFSSPSRMDGLIASPRR